MDNPTTAPLALVRRFLTQYYPDVEAALLAGSRSRAEGRDGSDYDVILLSRRLPDGTWRKMRSFEGQFIAAGIKNLF